MKKGRCPVPGCGNTIRGKYFMCFTHSRRCPQVFKDAIIRYTELGDGYRRNRAIASAANAVGAALYWQERSEQMPRGVKTTPEGTRHVDILLHTDAYQHAGTLAGVFGGTTEEYIASAVSELIDERFSRYQEAVKVALASMENAGDKEPEKLLRRVKTADAANG